MATSTPNEDAEPPQAPKSDFVIGRSVKTRVFEQINSGSYGVIHRGVLLDTDEEVAVKLEALKTCQRAEVLLAEGNALRHLEGGPGIPTVHWFGVYEPYYNGLVMEYLGPSIQDLFAYCHRKFSIKTILMLFDQIIDTFHFIHTHGYVYRDVKPDNFMIGRGSNANKVYIIDFGLAKKLTTNVLLARRLTSARAISPVHSNIGTPRYASIRAHDSVELGPSDDLEAFAYVCLYLFKGSLPWQGLPIENRLEKRAQIKQMKLDTTTCADMPEEFTTYLQHVRLGPTSTMPDHKHIKDIFQQLAAKLNIAYDFCYDWVEQKEAEGDNYESRGLTDKGHSSASPTLG